MRLSAYSRGFLSLVGAQNEGIGLRESSNFLQPTLDVTRFLGFDKLESIQGTNPLPNGTTDFPASLTVPLGEVWRLRTGSILATAGAGASSVNVGALARVGGSGGNSIFLTPPMQLAASSSTFLPILQDDLLLNAGSGIGAFASATVLAPTYVLTLWVERLKA